MARIGEHHQRAVRPLIRRDSDELGDLVERLIALILQGRGRLALGLYLGDRAVERGDLRVRAVGRPPLITDVGAIGPDYLPAHAHADTLSFELSLFGRRVVVNGGTSRYATGPRRDAERLRNVEPLAG